VDAMDSQPVPPEVVCHFELLALVDLQPQAPPAPSGTSPKPEGGGLGVDGGVAGVGTAPARVGDKK